MTATIVVPVDGSERADAALQPARWLARGLDAEVHVVTASFAEDTSTDQTVVDRALLRLQDARASGEVVRDRFAARAIIDTARSLRDTAVCMATHGRGALGEVLFGGIADDVLDGADVPVVLVGPSFDPDAGHGDHLVMCVDATPESADVVPTVLEWARSLGLTVHVVTVTDGHEPSPAATDAQRRADAVVRVLEAGGVDATVHHVIASDVEDAVLDVARSLDARLLAVASHGRFGFTDRPFGHIGTALVHESRCPVLVRRVPER